MAKEWESEKKKHPDKKMMRTIKRIALRAMRRKGYPI